MILGINLVCFITGRKGKRRTHQEAAQLCRNAGFEYIDCHINFTENQDYLDTARRLRRMYDNAGVKVHQVHLPMFRFRPNADGIKLFEENAPRAMECADILGAGFAVAHVDEYKIKSPDQWDLHRIAERTADYFSCVADCGEKYGIKPCIENLYEDDPALPANCRSRFSAETEDLLVLADLFDGKVGICWDFGHGQVAFGENMPEELKKVSRLLATTHVHDNHSGKDLHLPPFFGKIDWEKVTAYLGDIRYNGPMSIELLRSSFPDGIVEDVLNCLYSSGKKLISMAEQKQ